MGHHFVKQLLGFVMEFSVIKDSYIFSPENSGQIPADAVVRPVCGIFGIIRLVAGRL